MSNLSDRLLAMVRSASHEQQDYLEVIEHVLDQRQVDYDALADDALDHFLETGLDRDIGLVGVAVSFWLQNQDSESAARNGAELLASLAALGLPSAVFNVAVLQIRQGANLTEATKLVQEVSRLPDIEQDLRAQALAVLGDSLADGRGCRRDLDSAYACFEESARLGNPDAMFALGTFLQGKEEQWSGVRDLDRAADLYCNAMSLGVELARTNLGCLHAAGLIRTADREHGLALLRQSVAEGDMVARDALRALGQAVPGGSRDDRSIGGDDGSAGEIA
jgi:TPR repeat protein